MITHNLNVDNTLPEILDRLAALERNAQGRHMSVTEGLFRFYGGKLMGLAGAVLEWIGVIIFTGSVTSTGPWTNTGKLTNNGELEQNGPTKLKGGVDIEGLARLLNDLLIELGGQITVAGAIDLLIKNGQLTFANGATVAGSAGGVTVASGGGAQMQVSSTVASISSGSNSMRSDGTGNVVEGVTDFQDDVVHNGRTVLNGAVDASGLPPIPIAGAISGTLVRLSGGDQIYVAI